MFRNLQTNLRRQALFPYYTNKCEDGITPSHARVYCTSCLRILHQKLYICGGGKAYCVACFAGANLSGRCYVIKASFARQESPWIAIHQVLLLDLMQIHGFDNWQDISQGLQAHGLNFSSKEVEFHYYKYILPLTQMLPTQTCIKNSWNLDSQKKGRKKGRKDEEEYLIGYNPRRKEFYQEYNPQLESYIENLQFRDDDTAEDEESKFALLQAYCSGLKDRYKKYDFILEHKLLHPNEQNLKNALHLPEAEKMLSCFRKYTSYAEYIKLRENLVTMMKILTLIGHFQEKKQQANEDNPPGKIPRKRVHMERQNTLEKLQITEDDLQKIISLCRGRNGGDTLTFRGINVTLLKQLKK